MEKMEIVYFTALEAARLLDMRAGAVYRKIRVGIFPKMVDDETGLYIIPFPLVWAHYQKTRDTKTGRPRVMEKRR